MTEAPQSILMTKPTGYILWEGPSPIDGSPLVAIVTIKTTNRKTGNMAQVWILKRDLNPVDAIANGSDNAICGDCPHRKQSNGVRTCYVNVGQAPRSVWLAYQRGAYPRLSESSYSTVFSGVKVRWGAYGDPAMLPGVLFAAVNRCAAGHTAYTHQWRQPFANWAVGMMMASCDSVTDYEQAREMGWRTFNVLSVATKPTVQSKQCPATVEGSSAQCATCSLCNGARADIFVHAHGPSAKRVAYA